MKTDAKVRSEDTVRSEGTKPGRAASLRRVPFALVALFVVVGCIAALAYAINAWQVYGFAFHVWQLPRPLCFGAAVVADALSLAGLFATYLLRSAPRRVRAYAWFVFLGMTGLSIAAAEAFASWRGIAPSGAATSSGAAPMVAAAAVVVALALAAHLLIVAKRHVVLPAPPPDASIEVAAAEDVAGVPVELLTDDGRHPGVYRAIGEDPTPPLYIGSTTDLAKRICNHKRDAEWFPLVRRWIFEPYETLDDALLAERALIQAEQPIHNTNLRRPVARRRNVPDGTVVEVAPPSVDPRSVRHPQMPRRGRGGAHPPTDSGQQDEYARRVVEGGERAAAVASEVGKSKRAVEMWVKSYRERNPDPRPATMLRRVDFDTSPNVAHVNGAAPEIEVGT